MSLLVPDYASSSEDEETSRSLIASHTPVSPHSSIPHSSSVPFTNVASVASSKQKLKGLTIKTKKKKTKRRIKTALYLPPEIQRLLETGVSAGSFSEDSEDDNDLLAKQRQAKKAVTKRPRPAAAAKDSVLSFLPPPKHELPAGDLHGSRTVGAVDEERVEENQTWVQTTEAPSGQHPVDEETSTADAAAWQQYYQQQQYQASYAAASQGYYVAQGEDDVEGGSSKHKRTRERDIERALQEGHFETVAGQLAEVQGPLPNVWQPPVNPLAGSNGSSDVDVKVKASFWNAQAGTKVSSIKPSRLQRQKHQLNQLAFDAKARDFDLLDRRSASMKTKRETYAKYGW
uniref:Proline-rich protein PRCC n=1 Tax=Hyaloperonospora arabidopsidis (strain Emoy2) TaxID=559515 RepID=M4BJF6_HYAAE